MKRFRTKEARAAWSLARDRARDRALPAKVRVEGLALVEAGLRVLDGSATERELALCSASRRALSGASADGQAFEFREIASVLDRSVRAIELARSSMQTRLLGAGVDSETVDQLGPLVALRAVLPLTRSLLEMIDARLVVVPQITRTPPFESALRRLADRRVVIDGAIADLLLDTGALDTKSPSLERRSASRTRLQNRISNALNRQPKK